MGWFDEDDEDEEEERRKKPPLSMMMADLTESSDSKKPSDTTTYTRESNDEEDPLDAFMKNLTPTEPKRAQPKSTRLDMENEDEATSHWKTADETVKPTKTSKNDGDDDDYYQPNASSSNEARIAMQQMFHKASTNPSQQEERRINIQLNKVQHEAMGYHPFTKQLMMDAKSSQQGHNWRREQSVSCHPPLDPIYDFAELRDVLPSETTDWISRQEGMTKPTLVQSQTLSVALNGHDAIVTASTGSGKTLAYLFPLVTHLVENNQKNSSSECRALVLVPTRELALQVEKVAKSLLQKLPFAALAITGGNMGRYQLSQALLKTRPHLIVATPGRLLDVLSAQQKSKNEWLLKEITFLVLDEADKMLHLGFAPQVSQLLENLRPDRQSLLTSATLHGRLERHCRDWMHAPTRISIGRAGTSSEHVQQHVMCLPSVDAKQVFLKESLPTFCSVGRTIVFCATRDGCEQLAAFLQPQQQPTHGAVVVSAVPALETLHGDKHPSDRKAALRAFSKGRVNLLIATDVAGRGLDIPQVATVINYDPAKNWDTHVHRIGRAGRLNANQGGERLKGSAYTLLTPSNAEFAQTLVQAYEREGRPIDEEVRRLSHRSKQNTAGIGRKQRGIGLGYYGRGDAEQQQGHRKRSRWS